MRFGKFRGVLVVASAAGLVAAMSGAAAGQQASAPNTYTRFPKGKIAAQPVKPKHLTAAAQMTKDEEAPTRAFTAPTSMLVDPENPRVIVGGVAELRSRVCKLTVSTDAGHTWHFSKGLPGPKDYPFCTSTQSGVPEVSLAWGRNHTLYYGLMGYDTIPGSEGPAGDGHRSIALAKTTDLGNTWKTTLVTNNRGKTGSAPNHTGVTGLAVDTSGPKDAVYIGFSESFIPGVPSDSPLNNPRPMVSASTDGGDTFGEPVNLNDSANLSATVGGKQYKTLLRTGFGAPFLTVHNGVIVAVAGTDFVFNDRPTPPPEAGQGLTPGTFYAVPLPQAVARSTDGGKTWAVQPLGPAIYAGAGSMTGLGWTPKGGPNGTFVAAFCATPENSSTTGLADLVVMRSTDLGKTWTEPVTISDDRPDQHATNFYPELQVAPNGRVDVVWEDDRDIGDYRFNVRYTYSADGGATWAPNLLVSDRPLDFNFGISYNSDLRYPPGVASANQYAAFGWADTRLASDLTQTQDAFGSVAEFSALPATTNTTLPIVAAAFAGLVAAGIVLLIVLLVRRKGREPGAGERVGAEAVTAGEK